MVAVMLWVRIFLQASQSIPIQIGLFLLPLLVGWWGEMGPLPLR